MIPSWLYTLIPAAAAILGAAIAANIRLSQTVTSAIQHFAAGVVFAAAAGELLPDIMHQGSPWATVIGGGLGVIAMLLVKQLEGWVKGPLGLLVAIGVDVFIDGLVLGIAFAAGQKVGLLLTVALTLEVLFLGLTMAGELAETTTSRIRVVATIAALMLLLPVGALLGAPVGAFPPVILTGFFAFGLVALLYLVTEELLIEAHEVPDRPWVTAMFFAGFLALLVLEELVG
jgi:ZIP family zinc transporter